MELSPSHPTSASGSPPNPYNHLSRPLEQTFQTCCGSGDLETLGKVAE